ncbi:putative zinc-binding alcohol dehydrogenase [Hyaloscypha sp. PMI_1271]|nr:putative zinc-binding alcohol dehydrogenase [Hyaloscypha sp. PMI_1271]
MTDYKFEGWLGSDKSSVDGKMVWQEFEPKEWEETDIDIKVTHCGICGSDLHTLRSGWGPTLYPCCVGHEIVGTAVRVGSKAEGNIKVGDRVGVGCQADSCMNRLNGKCEACSSKLEAYCANRFVATYGDIHLNGSKSYGGYATYHRAPSHFVVKIPDGVSSAVAAPMLCAGITTYSPLKHYGCGPGKTVGVIGIGGLGHFAILWAKALGANRVVAISRKADKANDALKLGADAYISTDEDSLWAAKNAGTLDIIISTVSSSKTPISDYLFLLKLNGTLCQVGSPEDGDFQVPALSLLRTRGNLTGSSIGSPEEIREMLQFAVESRIQPMIEERPMKEANQAIIDMNQGKARYRYVLVNEENL